jgi:hypothetical protein
MTNESTNRDPSSEPAFRPFASLAFWCSLFLAAGLFAVLALSPKLRTYRDLSREYDSLHGRLVATEQRTETMAKVAEALEHDPEFAAELVRSDFDSPGDEERMLVDPQLTLRGWDSEPAIAGAGGRHAGILFDGPLLDTLCDDRSVRIPLMAASALLILAAFALCGDGSNRADREDGSGRGGIRAWLAARYRKSAAG